jgi:hypothetical protein
LPTGLSFCLSPGDVYARRPTGDDGVQAGSEDETFERADERAEIHFLAALVDELMKALLATGTMSRDQLQDIEHAVSARTGSAARAW